MNATDSDLPDNRDLELGRDEDGPDVEDVQSTLLPGRGRRNSFTPAIEPRRASPGATFLCILVPAFLGAAFYFVDRPAVDGNVTTKEGSVLKPAVPPTILISIDGFRSEYLTRSKGERPLALTLNTLAAEGVHAPAGMQPVMPSETFPNHWTLVTGLYAESHGIVGNTMYDPVKQIWFHHDPTHPQWWRGEPIWKTLMRTPFKYLDNENHTHDHDSLYYKTAAVFWPGSEVDTLRPDAFWPFDKSKSYEARVKRTIDLVRGRASDLDGPANFVTLYFNGVDEKGHEHGPESPEVDAAIEEVDKAITNLLSGLAKDPPIDCNIIIVSDHGMTEVNQKERLINIASAFPEGNVQDIRESPLGLWLNITTTEEEAYTKIKATFEGSLAKATVYYKENLPERWHLSKSPMVTRVVTVADIGYTVYYPHQELVPGASKRLPRDMVVLGKGSHGFDNIELDMQGIFIARGPSFERAKIVEKMRHIDIYPMICNIFSGNPAPNNGSVDVTKHLLMAST